MAEHHCETTTETPMELQSFQKAITFPLLYLSYVVCYLCRKNYSTFLRSLVSENALKGIDPAVFGSVLELTYGSGKLIAGPFVDSNDAPKLILVCTLILSGLINICLFQEINVPGLPFDWMMVDVALWGMNGFTQAFAWPALSAIFMEVYQESGMKATLYSILGTSQNFGSGMTPVLLSYFIETYDDWKLATRLPGLIALVTAAMLFLGLPNSAPAKKKTQKKNENGARHFGKIMMNLVTNRDVMLLSFGYLFLTVIRVTFNDWTFVFIEALYAVDVSASKTFLGSLELGGFIGGLSVGLVSDAMFGGRRAPLMASYSFALAAVVFAVFNVEWLMSLVVWSGSEVAFLNGLYFCFGFLTFSPHILVGLLARELFLQAPNTAGSFSKSISQFGGVLAGYPLSQALNAIKYFGTRPDSQSAWNLLGYGFILCALCASALFFLVSEAKPEKRKTA